MIAYVLYNKNTAAERMATDMVRRLGAEQVRTELIDADSPRGIQLAQTYDVLGRPAVLLVREDGMLVQAWQGEASLPVPADVAYLAHR